jgi:hypothetical protein
MKAVKDDLSNVDAIASVIAGADVVVRTVLYRLWVRIEDHIR